MTSGSGCCAECLAEMPDHWISDFWRYCPHSRAMSTRRDRGDAWTIHRGVKPKQAAKHLAKAVKLMKGHARARGLSLARADAMLTWLRERGRKETPPQGQGGAVGVVLPTS